MMGERPSVDRCRTEHKAEGKEENGEDTSSRVERTRKRENDHRQED